MEEEKLKQILEAVKAFGEYADDVHAIKHALSVVSLTNVVMYANIVRDAGEKLFLIHEKLHATVYNDIVERNCESIPDYVKFISVLHEHALLERALNRTTKGCIWRWPVSVPDVVETKIVSFLTLPEAVCYYSVSNIKATVSLLLTTRTGGYAHQRRVVNLLENAVPGQFKLVVVFDREVDLDTRQHRLLERALRCETSVLELHNVSSYDILSMAIEVRAKNAPGQMSVYTADSKSIDFLKNLKNLKNQTEEPMKRICTIVDNMNNYGKTTRIRIHLSKQELQALVGYGDFSMTCVLLATKWMAARNDMFITDEVVEMLQILMGPSRDLFIRSFPFSFDSLCWENIKVHSEALTTNEKWQVFCRALPKVRNLRSVKLICLSDDQQRQMLASLQRCSNLKEVVLNVCEDSEEIVAFVDSAAVTSTAVTPDIVKNLNKRVLDGLIVNTDEVGEDLGSPAFLLCLFEEIHELKVVGGALDICLMYALIAQQGVRVLDLCWMYDEPKLLTSLHDYGVLANLQSLRLKLETVASGVQILLGQIRKVGIMKRLDLYGVEKQSTRIHRRNEDITNSNGAVVLKELELLVKESKCLKILAFRTADFFEDMGDFLRRMQPCITMETMTIGRVDLTPELEFMRLAMLRNSPNLKHYYMLS